MFDMNVVYQDYVNGGRQQVMFDSWCSALRIFGHSWSGSDMQTDYKNIDV